MKTIESFLPVFTGFYNTIFECDEEQHIEFADGETIDDYRIDYADYQNQVAKQCVSWVWNQLQHFGFTENVEFECVVSPKYYNYSNDSINVIYSVTDLNLGKIKHYLLVNRLDFEDYLKERYTSCDGFISQHSTDADDWIENIEDKHKFGAILQFFFYNEYQDAENEMLDSIIGNIALNYEHV